MRNALNVIVKISICNICMLNSSILITYNILPFVPPTFSLEGDRKEKTKYLNTFSLFLVMLSNALQKSNCSK